jgi:hypothetical protein
MTGTTVTPLVDQENKGDPEQMLLQRIEKSKCMRIAFCAIGEMGHCTPIIRLMQACEEKGHTTALFTMLYAKDKVQKMLN